MNKALRSIQSELNAPKNQYNSFGKYKYRSCESILEAVKPLLKKHEAEVVLTDKIVLIGDRFYVEATAIFTCGEDTVVVNAYAREPEQKKGMDDSQITGTASSYARKYALNGLFLIDDSKDADTDEYHEQTTEVVPMIGEDEVRTLKDYAETLEVAEQTICERFNVNDLYDLDMKQYASAMRMLGATEQKRSKAS